MSSAITAAKRHRAVFLATTILALNAQLAQAQQPASPNVLPPVEVDAPAEQSKPRAVTAPERQSTARRAAPVQQRTTTEAPPQQGKPSDDQALVVSPTATVTPVSQIASSITVITAKDLERDQRRTLPD